MAAAGLSSSDVRVGVNTSQPHVTSNTYQPCDVQIGALMGGNQDERARALTAMVNRSYGYRRVSEGEMRHRLSTARNRVLHVAMRDGALVGCCSSTLHTPWSGPGCGHWGLLVVDPPAQGTGVASSLVHAAEQRLYSHGLRRAQIEYSFSKGDPQSERLLAWYEDALGYRGPLSRRSGFRMCRKHLQPDASELVVQTTSLHSGLCVCVEWLCAVLLWLFCGQY